MSSFVSTDLAFLQSTPIRLRKQPGIIGNRNKTKKAIHIKTTRDRWNRKHIRMNAQRREEEQDSFQDLQADIREYLKTCPESETSPLAYITLRKAGRVDLISRIMDAGGYIVVSQKLGVSVDENQFIPPPPTFAPPSQLMTGTAEDYNASLAIGRDLETRLNTIEDVMKNGSDSSKSGNAKLTTSVTDDVPSGEELRKQNEAILPAVRDNPVPIEERFTLTSAMRIGMLALAGLSAIGFGRASQGVVADDLISICRSLSEVLLIAHLSLGIYSGAILAPQKRRNPSLWFAKVVLGGPLGARYLRGLDVLPDSTR